MTEPEVIFYNGKKYYIDRDALDDKNNDSLFLYTDPALKNIAKLGSLTLMVKRKDIDYKLKESKLWT